MSMWRICSDAKSNYRWEASGLFLPSKPYDDPKRTPIAPYPSMVDLLLQEVDKYPMFRTRLGKSMALKESSIAKALSILDEEDGASIVTPSGRTLSVSSEAFKRARSLLGEPELGDLFGEMDEDVLHIQFTGRKNLTMLHQTMKTCLHWLSPLHPPPSSPPSTTTTTSSKPTRSFCLQAIAHQQTQPADTDLSLPSNKNSNDDQTLLSLLRQRKTEQPWTHYSQSPHLPTPTCLSRLVCQLSYQSTPQSLSRARSIITTHLRNERQLHQLDANSLGLLASTSGKSGHTLYASSLVKSMLRSGYLPHVKAWSAVVSRLSTESPSESISLFDAFLKLFDEMREWGCEADVLTYNAMIKLCARDDRKDLLVFVLERIIEQRIRFCMTTVHSLVAAYVGFDDLETAEKIVQAMREGRNDLCKILRDAYLEDLERAKEDDDDDDNYDYDGEDDDEEEDTKNSSQNKIDDILFEKLLPNSIEPSSEPPLLPKVYAPNSRIYTTLMEGYMKTGRVTDTVKTLEASRRQDDKASHPDNVTYTTIVSAFVKAVLMDRAREVLAEMTRICVPANPITYNILLKGYCQQLRMDKAKKLLRDMADDAGIKPDVVSYNILIDGCILIDDSAGALAFFNDMREQGITPTKTSYTTLMKAFALSGQPKLSNKVFDEMLRDPQVKVDLVAWNMLVEGYCRLGLVEEAKKVIQRMKENGFYPNVSTYGTLANGIALARKPGEALLLWQEIKDSSNPTRLGPGSARRSLGFGKTKSIKAPQRRVKGVHVTIRAGQTVEEQAKRSADNPETDPSRDDQPHNSHNPAHLGTKTANTGAIKSPPNELLGEFGIFWPSEATAGAASHEGRGHRAVVGHRGRERVERI
ncbi:Pentatricopeptide repeat-containing protein [Hibiscus syriacus]|uniref:Pentatricopeptide repeat-containing protein n=1 Tax=Hibiscus syriacus TaxID=106335 RepID=A0A6A3AQG7_HIBSY|nr:Pentatricopeptide repeat-containing protein [Hibiscus syriacus]